MKRKTIRMLHKLFMAHADQSGCLWLEDLRALMKTLNHPEDDLELELLMREWDVEQLGKNFSSIIP